MRRFQGGFTLLELTIAVPVAVVIFLTALAYIGHVFVESGDAVKAAQHVGIVDDPNFVCQDHLGGCGMEGRADTTVRHDFFVALRGCTWKDDVVFQVQGWSTTGEVRNTTVCCNAWLAGCHVALP